MTPEALEAWSIRCSCAAALPPPARKGNDSLRELEFLARQREIPKFPRFEKGARFEIFRNMEGEDWNSRQRKREREVWGTA